MKYRIRLAASFLLMIGCASEVPPEGPTVDAGPDQIVTATDTVTLSGAVPDAEGEVTTEWIQLSGPDVSLDAADTLAPSFTAPDTDAPVGLVFRLEATDEDGGVGWDEVSITVLPPTETEPPPPERPTVDAGDDQVLAEETEVTLSGATTDPDGIVASTRWVQIVGDPVALADPSALETTFTAPSTGADTILAFRLEALDADGAVLALDDVTVSVFTTNTAPTVDAGEDQTVAPGDVVTLTGVVTDADTVSTEWIQFAGPSVTLDDPFALTTTFTAPATDEPLVLGFRLEAEDVDGAPGADYMLVTVIPPPNVPPTADAGPDQSVTEGDVVTLAGVASDTDGVVSVTTWTEIGTSLVTLSDPNDLAATFTAPDVGFSTTIVLELEVEDDDGATATDRVAIEVHPTVPVNRAPDVFAGPNQTVASGSTVTLSGAATDPDGTIASTTWTQVAGPTVTLASPSALGTTFTAPVVSCAVLIVFELEAIDDEGARGTDRVSIVVDGFTGTPISVGAVLDLESDDGGLVTEGSAWQHGVPTSGPGTAYSGTRVWATELGGSYADNSLEVLCMPPIDLTGAADPILTFRAFMRIANGDGFTVEGLDPAAGWVPLTDTEPAMPRVAGGRPSFASTSPVTPWWLTAVRLPSWLGTTGRVRLVFSSNASFRDVGVYLDDVRIDEEASDPDADGLSGVLGEWRTHGTDPFVADTDGDSHSDGAEVTATTDPLNPADYPGRAARVAGFTLDFETDDGGLVAGDPLWQHGTPASGPGAAQSGTQGWATNLSGNYGPNQRAYLYLPPVDLSAMTAPTLAAQLWLAATNGDGLSVEVQDPTTGDWILVGSGEPTYESIDALGGPAWRNQRYREEYVTVALPLTAYVGSRVLLRIAFRTDQSFLAAGAYLDDLAIYDESDDPDGDGAPGILTELAAGTEPFVADTDGDGSNDGAESTAGTDPLNPTDFPGATALAPGFVLDFELGDGGLVGSHPTWEHGTPASGPGAAYSGTQAWATNLSGNYGANLREYLYLPPVDLSGTTAPTLSARLWLAASNGDGLSVEVWDATAGEWTQLGPDVPAYESTDALGRPAWRNVRYRGEYQTIAVPLDGHIGGRVFLRFAFRSDASFLGSGAYIDDVGVHDESADPDGDGLLGVADELLVYGTQPFIADTDGDGASDGAELGASTDPLDPAMFPAGPTLLPGDSLDFESGPGGLASVRSDWQHGVIASGPGVGASGTQGWATNLSGNYQANLREYLHLPPIDLTASSGASLTFQLWMDGTNGDGLSVERLTPAGDWATELPVTPAYDATDALGRPAWREQRSGGAYVPVEISLAPYAGQIVRLRLAFRSDQSFLAPGAYVDDVAVTP